MLQNIGIIIISSARFKIIINKVQNYINVFAYFKININGILYFIYIKLKFPREIIKVSIVEIIIKR